MLTWMPELKGRSLMRMTSFTDEEMMNLIDLAAQLKARRAAGIRGDLLHRRNIALIFEKSSTRTRNSSIIAARDEGGGAEYLTRPDIHFGKKESVKDTARVLGRIYDGILFRGFRQSTVEELAKWSGVPVWNGLTDDYHPTQIFADLLTVKETFGSLRDCTVAYVGDGRNNVANSLMVVSAKLGMHFCACGPKELMPAADLVEKCQAIAKETGAVLEFTDDVKQGAKDCDVLYTDIWVSMGEPAELWEQRIKLLLPYQVNKEVMAMAKPTAIFLHCLPSFHDRNTTVGEDIYQKFGLEAMEVTDDVFLGTQARQFQEAENRMHTIKAVMYATLK